MKTKTKATVIFAILLLELFGAPFFYYGVRAQQYHSFDYLGVQAAPNVGQVSNSCLSFNGVDNSGLASDLRPQNLTLEAWVKPKYTIKINSSSSQYYNHSDGYVISDFASYTGWWLRFVYDDGTLRFGWYYGTLGYSIEYAANKIIWYNDTWYHIAVTFNPTLAGDNLQFYINGTLDSKITDGRPITYYSYLKSSLQIGGWNGANSYYGGLIGEVRVWNTSMESRGYGSARANLVGYWRFDTVSEGITKDFSIYGRDCQVFGAQLQFVVTPGTPIYPPMYPYDVNYDGKIDGKDIALTALVFGTVLGDSKWNPLADVNKDGKIDGKDIALVALHFGEIVSSSFE